MNIIVTSDGSHTIFNEKIGEHYHSTFGAIVESKHIFIQAGLEKINFSDINILEVGFGTGLNALLSLECAMRNHKKVNYTAIEAFPVTDEMIKNLNYTGLLNIEKKYFEMLHSNHGKMETINEHFSFELRIEKIQQSNFPESFFDLVFFDAFSPDLQPEMWEKLIFKKIGYSMKRGGLLTTYSCKGLVKRNLLAAGFTIEKLAGPPGKREFLRASKI